jgi:competence protein ComEA
MHILPPIVITKGMMMLRRGWILFLVLGVWGIQWNAFAEEPININTADAETLAETLEGIGEKKAEAIVQSRTVEGPFESVDDLDRVSGIGPKLVDKNRHLMTVGEPESEPEAQSTETIMEPAEVATEATEATEATVETEATTETESVAN